MTSKPYKSRTESRELQELRILNKRMNLSEKEKQYYLGLEKGYKGEKLYDTFTVKLECDCLIVNDLLLQANNTTFQIDSLIILSEAVYLFEVKNFDGDYYMESDRFYKKPKVEYNNPLHQLERSESLLRQLLDNLGYKSAIEGNVVFINPEFTLYQAPLNKPLIFPTQVKRYLKNLDKSPSKLNRKHKLLADKLISLHMGNPPYSQVPDYNYSRLRKGVTCARCNSFSILCESDRCICQDCGYEELVTSAVMRSVNDFRTLFPDEKITTNIIHEWSNAIVSKRRIRSILGENLNIIGVRQWAYYE